MIVIRHPATDGMPQGRAKSWVEMTPEERHRANLDVGDAEYWAIEDASAREGMRRGRDRVLRLVAWEIAQGQLGLPAPDATMRIGGRFTEVEQDRIAELATEFRVLLLRRFAARARERGQDEVAAKLEAAAVEAAA